MRIKKQLWFIAVIGFVLSLSLVEVGPFSPDHVAEYNSGYGTFDMKQYAYEDVNHVLSHMEPYGFLASNWYYVCDTVFIVCFGLLQILTSLTISKTHKRIGKLALLFCILRGVLDLIENVSLLHILHTYPDLNRTLITITSWITKCKLFCIGIWVALFALHFVCKSIQRNH